MDSVIGVDVSKYEVHDIKDDSGHVTSVKEWWSPDKSKKLISFVGQRVSYGGKQDEYLDLLYAECVKISIRFAYHYYSSAVRWQTQLDTILKAMDGKIYHFTMMDYEKLYNNLNATTFAEMMELNKQLKIETKLRSLNYFSPDVYKTAMKPYNANAVINQMDLCEAQYPFTAFLNLEKGPAKIDGINKVPEFWQFGAADVAMTAGYTAGFDYGSWRHGIDLIQWPGTIETLIAWVGVQPTTPPIVPPPPLTLEGLGQRVDAIEARLNKAGVP